MIRQTSQNYKIFMKGTSYSLILSIFDVIPYEWLKPSDQAPNGPDSDSI